MTKRQANERDDDSDTTTTVVEHKDPVVSALTSPPTVRNDDSTKDAAKHHAKPSKSSADRQRVAKELQGVSDRLNDLQHKEFDSRIDAAKRQIDAAIQGLQQEDPAPVMTEEEALAQMAPPTLPKPNIPSEQGGQQPQPGKPDTSVVL